MATIIWLNLNTLDYRYGRVYYFHLYPVSYISTRKQVKIDNLESNWNYHICNNSNWTYLNYTNRSMTYLN